MVSLASENRFPTTMFLPGQGCWRWIITPLCVTALWIEMCGQGAAAEPDRSVDFAKEIQPIFEAHCYACHGPEQQKNGLRLDSRAAALAGGDSGPAILPGNSSKSRLIQ